LTFRESFRRPFSAFFSIRTLFNGTDFAQNLFQGTGGFGFLPGLLEPVQCLPVLDGLKEGFIFLYADDDLAWLSVGVESETGKKFPEKGGKERNRLIGHDDGLDACPPKNQEGHAGLP